MAAGNKTLVYSPEVRIVIEDTDVSRDLVRGNVSRITDGASSISFQLSNKDLRYNDRFKRMDRVVVWMKRVKWVKVFTGYLNRVPVLQLYPSTVTFTASCTIKRLLYLTWDPALPESLKLLNQYDLRSAFGPGSDSAGAPAPPPTDEAADPLGSPPPTATDAPQSLEDLLMPNVGDNNPARRVPANDDTGTPQPADPAQDPLNASYIKDGGLGQMLQNILVKVGGWETDDIKIQEFPESFLGYIEERMPEIENLDPEAVKKFKEMFEFDESVVSGGAGGGGGGSLGEATFTTIGPPANGTNYNMDELVWIVRNAGWSGDDVAIGAAIIQAESSGNPGAINPNNADGSIDRGLWQINSIHDGRYPGENRFDPAVSTKLARDIYSDSGSWRPWSTYSHHGTYTHHLDAARAAAARGGTPPPNSGTTGGTTTPGKPAPIPTPGNTPGTGQAPQGSDPNAPDTAGMSIQDSMVAVIKYRFPGPNDGGVFQITSRSRNEPGSFHDFSENKAIDVSNGGDAGTPEMKALAQWIYDNYFGKGILELIHSPFNHNVGNINGRDVDVGDGMSNYYNPGTMAQHRNHVHWAMSRVVAADGTTMPDVGGGGVSGSGGSQVTFNNRLAKNIFTYLFDATGYNSDFALQLGGRYASLNDEPLIKIVKALCEARMCSFQSAPDGRFVAFYPDYFGLDNTAPTLKLEDVELKDVRIDANDDALTTHVFTMGADTMGGIIYQASDLGYLRSPGVVTVEDEWLFKRATEGFYTEPEFTNAEELLDRYGVRIWKGQFQNIYQAEHPEAMLLVAIKTFMQKWAEQFETQIELTFMPELFPGMRVELVSHDLVVYVKSVHHNFDFQQGFTTTAQVMAPMSKSRSPLARAAATDGR